MRGSLSFGTFVTLVAVAPCKAARIFGTKEVFPILLDGCVVSQTDPNKHKSTGGSVQGVRKINVRHWNAIQNLIVFDVQKPHSNFHTLVQYSRCLYWFYKCLVSFIIKINVPHDRDVDEPDLNSFQIVSETILAKSE